MMLCSSSGAKQKLIAAATHHTLLGDADRAHRCSVCRAPFSVSPRPPAAAARAWQWAKIGACSLCLALIAFSLTGWCDCLPATLLEVQPATCACLLAAITLLASKLSVFMRDLPVAVRCRSTLAAGSNAACNPAGRAQPRHSGSLGTAARRPAHHSPRPRPQVGQLTCSFRQELLLRKLHDQWHVVGPQTANALAQHSVSNTGIILADPELQCEQLLLLQSCNCCFTAPCSLKSDQ